MSPGVGGTRLNPQPPSPPPPGLAPSLLRVRAASSSCQRCPILREGSHDLRLGVNAHRFVSNRRMLMRTKAGFGFFNPRTQQTTFGLFLNGRRHLKCEVVDMEPGWEGRWSVRPRLLPHKTHVFLCEALKLRVLKLTLSLGALLYVKRVTHIINKSLKVRVILSEYCYTFGF